MEGITLPEYKECFLDHWDEEQAWIKSIEVRVGELLDKDPGLLFSHLYRLDVDEQILKNILRSTASDELAAALSVEIWKRQKSRIQSRRDHPQSLMLDQDI